MQRENLKKYLIGSGIDLSRNHYIQKAFHKYKEPGNLYSLRDIDCVESQNYLFSRDIINETKYFRILLYEWFLMLQKGGYLIIEMQDNQILNYSRLKKEIDFLQLFKGRYSVIKEYFTERSRRGIVLQKTKSIVNKNDSIEKWTFGIVTNGKRREFVEKSLGSIMKLNIPQYEIIICGVYDGQFKGKDNVKYIHFTEKDDRGWITKKKNIICKNAKYENIVIIHDRIYFDRNWFLGMKRWGNYFDVLSCPIILPSGTFTNWETVGPSWSRERDQRLFHSNAHLDSRDWDENVYVGGAFIVLKKSIWRKQKWNEKLFWGDAEDIEYSLRQHRTGTMIRFNPFSKVYSFTFSGIFLKHKNFYARNSQKLGKYHGVFLLTYFLKFLDFLGFRRNQKIIVFLVRFFKRITGSSDWRMEIKKN